VEAPQQLAAVSLSRQLLGIAQDLRYSYPSALARDVGCYARNAPSMRDELYCQLMRLLTRNPSTASSRRLWSFLSCCLSCFPPSHALVDAIHVFLHAHDRSDLVHALYRGVVGFAADDSPSLAELEHILA
jgi:hypothetical protein